MNNLTVKEIRDKKENLEHAITQLIKTFNSETNTCIYSINLKYLDFETDYGYYSTVLQQVKINLDYERSFNVAHKRN